jgi:hypothetical protein
LKWRRVQENHNKREREGDAAGIERTKLKIEDFRLKIETKSTATDPLPPTAGGNEAPFVTENCELRTGNRELGTFFYGT